MLSSKITPRIFRVRQGFSFAILNQDTHHSVLPLAQHRLSGRQIRSQHGKSDIFHSASQLVERAETKLQELAIQGSKRIFLFNLKKKMAALPEVFGLEEGFLSRVNDAFEALYETQEHTITDRRSRYHLQTACLVLASYRTLTQQLGVSHDLAIKTIQGCTGDSNSWIERTMRSGLSSVSRVLAGRDTYVALRQAAHGMASVDFGDSFAVAHSESPPAAAAAAATAAVPATTTTTAGGPSAAGGCGGAAGARHVTTVTRCFYNDFFRRHGAGELTGPIFCRADAALFASAVGLPPAALQAGAGGARFALESTLAQGATACSFVIERTHPAAGMRRAGRGRGD